MAQLLPHTVTVRADVAGPQPCSVDLVGAGGANPYLSVRLGRTLVYVHDRQSVMTFAEAWRHAHQHAIALLPSELSRPLPTVPDIATVYVALGLTDSSVLGVGAAAARHSMAHVVVRVGPLTTRAFDRRSVEAHLAAWVLAVDLCERAFHDPDGPFPTRQRQRAADDRGVAERS